ncbi:hypothetical protein BH10PSE17_BH10PSE17_35680 [soil metagenome]
MASVTINLTLCAALLAMAPVVIAADEPKPMRIEPGAARPADDTMTPEQRMERRWPQKVRVGDLLGLPMLDDDDRTLGHVDRVMRTAGGKLVLVMPFGGWFGRGGRPVGVPIETVAILARHIDVLDIARADFDALATWSDGDSKPVPPDETIRIAITRR